MRVTKVMLYTRRKAPHILTFCSVIMDDSLKLNDIQLCEKGTGERFLILPSRQDIYDYIGKLNKESVADIVLPEVNSATVSTNDKNNKKYEEFFHPVSADLYREILHACSTAYDELDGTDKVTWRPN